MSLKDYDINRELEFILEEHKIKDLLINFTNSLNEEQKTMFGGILIMLKQDSDTQRKEIIKGKKREGALKKAYKDMESLCKKTISEYKELVSEHKQYYDKTANLLTTLAERLEPLPPHIKKAIDDLKKKNK